MPSSSQIEIIAEIAQAHDGSLGIAHSYIDALASTGVDTVKFQMHIASAESSEFEQFRVNFSFEDKTRYDYWERMGFTFEQWVSLKLHCEEKGLKFLCSPFSIQAVEWMEQLKVDRYKIASGEVNNYLMLDIISKTKKPILLSSGMSSFDEIDAAVNFIGKCGGTTDAVFQCTTAYPTPPEKYGLNVLAKLKEQYKVKVGLSDHSGKIYAGLAAAALGADLMEMHVVFDKSMFGPDASSSLTISDFKQLVEGVRSIETAIQNPIDKSISTQYNELKTMFGKSLSINKDVKAGHIISINDLETRKPGDRGLSALLYQDIIGKSLNKDLKQGSFINLTDIN